MIDTVRFRQTRHLRESVYRRNWDIKAVMREVLDTDGFEDEQLHGYRGVHKKYGINFFGDRDQIVSVEASLPRVLFGTNGKLLRSQAHIQAAFRRLDRILDSISHRTSRPRHFTRVDLVWHVPGRCEDFIAAHEHVRHPRVRNATSIYQGQSITWGGSALRLVLYDKVRKERGRPGDFVRVEAQLRGHMLEELLEESGHEVDFDGCYRHLRRLVRQLAARQEGEWHLCTTPASWIKFDDEFNKGFVRCVCKAAQRDCRCDKCRKWFDPDEIVHLGYRGNGGIGVQFDDNHCLECAEEEHEVYCAKSVWKSESLASRVEAIQRHNEESVHQVSLFAARRTEAPVVYRFYAGEPEFS